MEEKPSYYAIIPADVRYDKDLPPMAKLLYGEITCLTQKNGFCWATNSYFADLYGMSKDRISKLIGILEKKGYISVYVERNEKNEVVKRYIKLRVAEITIPSVENNENSPVKNNYTSPVKNNEENNINLNNTRMNNTSLKEVSPPGGHVPKPIESKAIELANLMCELHKQVDPKLKSPNIEKWAADIEKINRLDGRSYEDIEKVIRWIKTPGNFWFANIMSGNKLRLQFSRLYIEACKNIKKGYKPVMQNDVYKGSGEDW